MVDYIYDVGLTRAQRRSQQQLRRDIGWLVRDPRGVRVAAWLLGVSGVFTTNPGLNGPAEGRRQIGIALVEMIRSVDPTLANRVIARALAGNRAEGDDGVDEDDREVPADA